VNAALDTAHEIIAGSDVEFKQIKYLIDFFLPNLSKELGRDFQFFFLQP